MADGGLRLGETGLPEHSVSLFPADFQNRVNGFACLWVTTILYDVDYGSLGQRLTGLTAYASLRTRPCVCPRGGQLCHLVV